MRRGKYKLRPQYRHLEVSESKWFKMTREQRARHLKKVNDIPVSNVMKDDHIAYISEASAPSCSGTSENQPTECTPSSLSKELVQLSPHLGLPVAAVEAIARKASEILNEDGAIVPAPGHDSNARMVISRSGKRPHLVVPKKNGGMACDEDCPQYKSAGLCSHVVAAAQQSKQLPRLVSTYKNVKRSPNLASGEMPKGRGRKGGKAPAKRKSSVPVDTRYELQITSQQSVVTVTSCPITVNASAANTSLGSTASQSYVSVYPPFQPSPSVQPYGYISGQPSTLAQPCGFNWGQPLPTVPPHGVEHPFRICFVAGNISVCKSA